jgi:ABC-type dipeptide/oligopeptide/nickel transport system permease component
MSNISSGLVDVLHGDLGRSILSHEQVTTEIGSRFPNTIELAIAAMIFAILIGVVAGIISATKQYSVADYSVMGLALFGISMPVFWLGIMLMMILACSSDGSQSEGESTSYCRFSGSPGSWSLIALSP